MKLGTTIFTALIAICISFANAEVSVFKMILANCNISSIDLVRSIQLIILWTLTCAFVVDFSLFTIY